VAGPEHEEYENAVKLNPLTASYNEKRTAYWHYDPSARAIQEYLAGHGDATVNPYGYGEMQASEAHAMLLKLTKPSPEITVYHGGPLHPKTWTAASPYLRVAEAFDSSGEVYVIHVPEGTPILVPSALDAPAEIVFPPGGIPETTKLLREDDPRRAKPVS